MSTWISRSIALAFCAVLLSGCDQATGLPFAAGFGALAEPSGRARLAQADLAGGAVTLSAPEGYCFDRRSLRNGGGRGFALMARCDTLGVRGFFGAHDIAIVTITTAPRPQGAVADPGLDALEATGAGAPVLARQRRDGVSLIRFGDGAPPMEDVGTTHWRGAFALNGQLVGLALYAPEGSGALRDSGAELLFDLVRRTRAASPSDAIATAD